MIKTQDLKTQMDELTKQNDMVLMELELVKKMLLKGEASGGSQGQSQSQGQNQNQSQNQSATSGQGSSGAGGQGQQSGGQQSNQQQSGQSGSQGSCMQVPELANELLKIKDLVEKLEQKTSQYVSSQSNGSLTEKDVVNLVLTLMNGMVDWATEFVSSKASGSGQVQ